MFVVEYEDTRYLYRISQSNINKLKGKTFYKVSFYLSDQEIKDIDKITSKTRVIVPDITDTKKFRIVDEDIAVEIKRILNYINAKQDTFLRLFVNKTFKDLIFNWVGGMSNCFIRDKYTNIFIKEFDLLKKINPKRNEFFISNKFYDLDEFSNKDDIPSLTNLIKGTIALEDFTSQGVVLSKTKILNWEPIAHFPQTFLELKEVSGLVISTVDGYKPLFRGLRNFLEWDGNSAINDDLPIEAINFDEAWYTSFLCSTPAAIATETNFNKVNRFAEEVEFFKYTEVNNPIFKLIKNFLKKDYETDLSSVTLLLKEIKLNEQTIETFYLAPLVLFILKSIYNEKVLNKIR